MGKIKEWASTGFILSSAAGTVLHFVYGWFGALIPVMILGAVNESVWEHLKLLFWPVFIFSIIEFIVWGYLKTGFLYARILAACCGMAFIVVVFYTYSGILGRSFVPVDIALFFVAVAITFRLSTFFLKRNFFESLLFQILGWVLAAFLVFVFIRFTFFPPGIPLFEPASMGCCRFL